MASLMQTIAFFAFFSIRTNKIHVAADQTILKPDALPIQLILKPTF